MDSSSAAAAGFSLLSVFFCCFFVILGLIFIALTVLWILMLIDAIKRDWPDRQMWILILAISFVLGFHVITAIVYYFAVKKPNIGTLRP